MATHPTSSPAPRKNFEEEYEDELEEARAKARKNLKDAKHSPTNAELPRIRPRLKDRISCVQSDDEKKELWPGRVAAIKKFVRGRRREGSYLLDDVQLAMRLSENIRDLWV